MENNMEVSELFLEVFPGVLTVICSKCDEYISHEDFPEFDPVESDECPYCKTKNTIVDE